MARRPPRRYRWRSFRWRRRRNGPRHISLMDPANSSFCDNASDCLGSKPGSLSFGSVRKKKRDIVPARRPAPGLPGRWGGGDARRKDPPAVVQYRAASHSWPDVILFSSQSAIIFEVSTLALGRRGHCPASCVLRVRSRRPDQPCMQPSPSPVRLIRWQGQPWHGGGVIGSSRSPRVQMAGFAGCVVYFPGVGGFPGP